MEWFRFSKQSRLRLKLYTKLALSRIFSKVFSYNWRAIVWSIVYRKKNGQAKSRGIVGMFNFFPPRHVIKTNAQEKLTLVHNNQFFGPP